MKELKPTDIIRHAEIASAYFSALLSQNMPLVVSIQLTQSYMSTVVLTEAHGEKPEEPWNQGGPPA